MSARQSGVGWAKAAYSGYAAAALAVGAAYLIRLAASPILGGRSVFLVFVLPVVFSVLASGRGPALLAGVLSLVAGVSLTDPEERLTAANIVQMSIFMLVCGGIGWLDARLSAQRELTTQARREM